LFDVAGLAALVAPVVSYSMAMMSGNGLEGSLAM
jgi:hypothetical protein